MSTATEEGYLVLADISGYTSFIAQTELEHAHEILTELLELIVSSIKPVMTISKLEGDAVFAYVPSDKISRGETVLELVEATYVAFRNKTQIMHSRTTCTCNACRNIPKLDLKFITHYGSFILQKPVAGLRELVGSDVNLAHRLLKNHVSEETKWRAYALFTEKTLDMMGVRPEKMFNAVETYEHLGDVRTYSMNLHERFSELTSSRQLVIHDDEADLLYNGVLPVPTLIFWEWLTNPLKRNQWGSPDAHWSSGIRPGGRTAAGATNHCAHGKSAFDEKILDWKPFEYLTTEMTTGPFTIRFTYDLQAVENGTKARMAIRAKTALPRFVGRPLFKFMMIKVFKFNESVQRLIALSTAESEAQRAAEASADTHAPSDSEPSAASITA